jgi:putative spermidine/putrescine transport system permease protein
MVILPTLRPALSAAFVLTFLMSVGSFGIALLVAKEIAIYPVIIFKEFTGFANFGIASAMAITLCLLVILVLMVLRRNYPDLELFSSQAR